MKLKPMSSRIIVKRDTEERSAGGIILSQAVQYSGTVVEVGPETTVVGKGDKIIFGTFAGTERELPLHEKGYENCFIMNEEDILCLVEE